MGTRFRVVLPRPLPRIEALQNGVCVGPPKPKAVDTRSPLAARNNTGPWPLCQRYLNILVKRGDSVAETLEPEIRGDVSVPQRKGRLKDGGDSCRAFGVPQDSLYRSHEERLLSWISRLGPQGIMNGFGLNWIPGGRASAMGLKVLRTVCSSRQI